MGEDDAEYAEEHEDAESIVTAMKEAISQVTEGMDSDKAARAATLAARQLAEEYGHIIQEPQESEEDSQLDEEPDPQDEA